MRPRLSSIGSSSGDAEVDDQVWSQTIQEVEKCWPRGPLTASEILLD